MIFNFYGILRKPVFYSPNTYTSFLKYLVNELIILVTTYKMKLLIYVQIALGIQL